MTKKSLTRFDIAEYLDNDEVIAEYLNSALEEGDIDDLIAALGHVARARGMAKIAADTGLSRPSLYKALTRGSKPQFETIMRVIKALGGNLTIELK